MKFYIDYISKEGDMTHVWVEAENEIDARHQAHAEYHDIDTITYIH